MSLCITYIYGESQFQSHVTLVRFVVPVFPTLTPGAASVRVVARLVVAGVTLRTLQHSHLITTIITILTR